jgi:RNA polymerase sporulation-specific sigma factor
MRDGTGRWVRVVNEILMHFRSLRKTAQDVFISDPIDVDKEGNSLTLQDIMADEDNIFEHIDLRLKSEKLYRYLEKHLTPRERQTVVMRYGLLGAHPMTQREVADALQISRSYVSRIEKKAIQVLRGNFMRDGFE